MRERTTTLEGDGRARSRPTRCVGVLLLALLVPPNFLWAQGEPVLLADVASEPLGPSALQPPEKLVRAGDRVLFATEFDGLDRLCAFWSFDGTAKGALRLLPSPRESAGHCLAPLASLGSIALLSGPGALWRSDGTRSGTYRILAGPWSWVYPLGVTGRAGEAQTLLVLLCEESGTCAVWRSDGSEAGTRKLLRRDGTTFSPVGRGLAFRGEVWFTLLVDGFGVEIYSTDGTEAGTVQRAGLAGPRDGTSSFAVTPGLLFYSLTNEDWEQEVWVTDGRIGGARRLGAYLPCECTIRGCFRYVNELLAVGDEAVWAADDGVHGLELWHSDGTVAGTRRLTALPRGAYPFAEAVQRRDGLWIFAVAGGLPGNPGLHLWTSSGDPASTAPLRGCAGGCPMVQSILPQSLQPPGRLLFLGSDPRHGVEPWSTDGTPEGTVRLADLCPGPCGTSLEAFPASAPSASTRGTRVLFRANANRGTETKPDWTTELWATDGTVAGTERLASQLTSEPQLFQGRMLFADVSGSPPRWTLWSSDGTTRGTRMAAVLSPGAARSEGSFPRFWPAARGVLFSTQEKTRQRLWHSDGMPAGTAPLAGVEAETSHEWIGFWGVRVGTRTFFERQTWPEGHATEVSTELWCAEEGADGARRLAILPQRQRIAGLQIAWRGGLLFLVEGAERSAFWFSDGTPAGTHPLLDVPARVRQPTAISSQGGAFLFVARRESDVGPIPQLFVSDGTAAGTLQLSANADPGEVLFDARFAEVGGRTYVLLGGPGYYDTHLWVTDGTPEGTQRVLPSVLDPWDLTAFGGSLYYTALVAPDGSCSRALYRWDPDAAQALLLATVELAHEGAPCGYSYGLHFTLAGGRLFFTGIDAAGLELWATDGTPAGTRPVRDLLPGSGSSFPANLTSAGDALYFSAQDGVHGRELWRSDGTEAGTRMVVDLHPGFLSALAWNLDPALILWDGRLFFAADDGVHGVEPWVLRVEH